MGWGRLYGVSDGVSQLLSTCRTKAQWYEALSKLDLDKTPQLNAEDSIRVWASKLQSIDHPAAKFFVGDLHAEYDTFDDPNVCFIGGKSVCVFLSQLEELGKQFFIALFPHDGVYGVGESWLYDPLCSFLRETCKRGNAVIMLWEN
ncbi:Uncharacterised protein [Burkholderia pseudomallei]|uniref:hypothetical protein n=1 Tax=Burkholderia pseudomallei TaxID=28450 RepID=UPI000F066398|nr:hypothetical protein [Burkholderia pseudomallei]CAJ2746800.1 Uncharacterised protein [Burkholderia pseudomallei]VCJ93237.1 Uncharacterised protein [Burkholderia pseudomallei]VCJ94869.1 Uncharacterised protein [Burkholderia pseudomallei]VCJ95764.1 Uncharacterised protein [Burkholderia pseudomallei]VCJ97336.1 Uncharacterised protein [Burkholderia pseudomallei]